jgi:hypothetical protein
LLRPERKSAIAANYWNVTLLSTSQQALVGWCGQGPSDAASHMCVKADAPNQTRACGNNDPIVDGRPFTVDTLPAQLVHLPRLN